MRRRAASIALGGLALILIALMFGTAVLLVPGIAFALLGAAAPAWVYLAARGVGVRRHLDARRVLEDEPLEATLEVRARRPRLTAADVIEPLVPAAIPVAAGKLATPIRIVFSFSRRGRKRIEPPSLAVRDPLEIAVRFVRGDGPPSELLVLPRTEAVRSIAASASQRDDASSGARPHALAAVDLDGLRPYRPGTPAARIHWPALARGAGLVERRLQAETDTRPLIVLDSRGELRSEHLDAAVRAAASLALELARAGGCGLLLPGERRPTAIGSDLHAWPAAHARLAFVQGGPRAPAPALSRARARLAPVFYIAARALERLPPAAAGIARGKSVLVLPAALDLPLVARERTVPASFEVCGCRGYVISARAERPVTRKVAASAGAPTVERR